MTLYTERLHIPSFQLGSSSRIPAPVENEVITAASEIHKESRVELEKEGRYWAKPWRKESECRRSAPAHNDDDNNVGEGLEKTFL